MATRRTANRAQTSPRGPRLTRPGRRRPLFRRDLDRANSGEDIGAHEGASFDVVPEGQLEGIYVINSDGSGLREVVAPRAGLEHPDWSPDGRSIMFNIEPANHGATDSGSILSVRPDGSGLRVLQRATRGLRFFKAGWSPDGRQMLSGCRDTQARIGRICTISHGGRINVVVGGPQRVNFRSWGSDD